MYIVTRRVEGLRSIAEATQRAEAGLVPLLEQATGFKGYHIVDAGGGVGLSVTMFDSRENAERVRDQAMAWIKANMADLWQGEPLITAGEVVFSARPGAPHERTAAAGAEARPH